MGEHPEFERTRIVSHGPLANDIFYAIDSRGPIDLTPLIVTRFCQKCKQQEVCFADRVDAKSGVSLKSFSRGHVIFDDSLMQEVLSLGSAADDDAT